MNCYLHPETVAVGSCKYCFKGVCASCAVDTGVGLACTMACEAKVKATDALIERNKKMASFGAKTHSRNASLLALMSVLFLAFGYLAPRGFLSLYMVGFGVVLAVGALLAAANARRLGKL